MLLQLQQIWQMQQAKTAARSQLHKTPQQSRPATAPAQRGQTPATMTTPDRCRSC
jgi:hypothetical protein